MKNIYLTAARLLPKPSISVFILCLMLTAIETEAQCPTNIGFEDGTFNGWKTYTGRVTAVNGQNVMNLTQTPAPIANRHTMLSAVPGDGTDPYGRFPVNCPNGSGHSIKLGNNTGGAEAEAVSYEFTIPIDKNEFSLTYYYAVVFEDPGHPGFQQPRLDIEILNVTNNTPVECSSFDFIATASLPGFFQSASSGLSPVWCKNWSATSVNLDGNAGKTIRLTFKTADCTFSAHFGYAYVDVSTECSTSFLGAAFCPTDTAINVRAPFGYQSYKWFNNNFTQVLGSSQILNITPVPVSGTVVAVEITPYAGYGCKDTLYANLLDTLNIVAYAGQDKLTCNNTPTQLGGPPREGVIYSWSPTTGLSNPSISNPIATPSVSTNYVLTARNTGGGCISTDTVRVNAGVVNNTITLTGSSDFCVGSGQSAILSVASNDSIQWYLNNNAIPGATQTNYTVTQSGVYYATIFNNAGCSQSTATKTINIYPSPLASFTPNNATQCLTGNAFNFTNNTALASGTPTYAWDFGDGSTSALKDGTHSYTSPGTYTVKLLVTAAGGCTDDTSIAVTIHPVPTADFSVSPTCINLPLTLVDKSITAGGSTLQYLWDFGNGQTSTSDKPVFSYPVGGTYKIKLTVSTVLCPTALQTKEVGVKIESPVKGISYPEEIAIFNFPRQLNARPIGTSVFWTPAENLNDRNSYHPIFTGIDQTTYYVQLKTPEGCITVDTQVVKTIKKIEIYVPTAFSPNNDRLNDYLKPILYGIKKTNYFKVFNRWGKLVYQSKANDLGWDGKLYAVPQPSAAYAWVLEVVDVDGKVHYRQGSTVLVR